MPFDDNNENIRHATDNNFDSRTKPLDWLQLCRAADHALPSQNPPRKLSGGFGARQQKQIRQRRGQGPPRGKRSSKQIGTKQRTTEKRKLTPKNKHSKTKSVSKQRRQQQQWKEEAQTLDVSATCRPMLILGADYWQEERELLWKQDPVFQDEEWYRQKILMHPQRQAMVRLAASCHVQECRHALAMCSELCKRGRATPKTRFMKKVMTMPGALQRQILFYLPVAVGPEKGPNKIVPGIYLCHTREPDPLSSGFYKIDVFRTMILYPGLTQARMHVLGFDYYYGATGYTQEALWSDFEYGRKGKTVGVGPLVDYALDPTFDKHKCKLIVCHGNGTFKVLRRLQHKRWPGFGPTSYHKWFSGRSIQIPNSEGINESWAIEIAFHYCRGYTDTFRLEIPFPTS